MLQYFSDYYISSHFVFYRCMCTSMCIILLEIITCSIMYDINFNIALVHIRSQGLNNRNFEGLNHRYYLK